MPLDLVFRTLGPWGAGKGAKLTPAEVDTNFYELAQEIVDLVSSAPEPVGIQSITISGTQMTITLTDGSVMGPFTIPVLTFRWRGEFLGGATYAVLDVFTVTDASDPGNTLPHGIWLVQVAHTAGATFDPSLDLGTGPVYLQLFGSVDTKLSTLEDVQITALADGDFLYWVGADQKWENVALGDMAFQLSNNVDIIGGTITGMPSPVNSSDVATKAYVDALPLGMSVPDGSIMSNISGSTNPAIAHPLSDILDHIFGTTVRGTLIFRGGPGWLALAPGSSGSFLQSHGAGSDPTWTVGGAGVTSISAGVGITTGAAPITTTGSVSLANIPDGDFLGNIIGSAAAPVPLTISQFLDHVLSTARGSMLTRASGGWVALAPGIAGQYLKTAGAGADLVWDSPAGSGTVISISAGTGIATPGGVPITSAGAVSLAPIPDGDLLANTSGASAAPVPTTVSLLFDHVFAPTRGVILYRGSAGWSFLATGTAGQVLSTGGAAGDPAWINAPVGSAIANLQMLANISGGSTTASGHTVSDVLDAVFSSSRGAVIFRGASGWAALAPGSSGQVLQTGGASADPSWATNGGGLISITSPQPQDVLTYNSSSGRFENTRPKYNIGAYVAGGMIPAQNLLFHKFSKAVTLPANLGNYLGHLSEAGAGSAATASTAINLSRAAAATPTVFTTVATITFAAGAVAGSMSTQAAIAFAQGDVLRVRGPTTPDATLADFHMALVGWET